MYRIIEPEVAGELGKETIGDFKTHPPIIKKLHYEFFGWMGDDIIESFPCFIMSERLKNEIYARKLSGITFDEVLITKNQEFFTRFANRELPEFFWAKIDGIFDIDDFIIGHDFRMIISEKAYQTLKLFNFSHASLEDLNQN